MTTKTETKNVKTVGNLEALTYGQMWSFFDGKYPAFNPGRDDSESWGFPTSQIPQGMAKGYDLSKGAMVAIDIATAKRIFAELAKVETDENRRKLFSQIAADPAKVAAQQRKDRAIALRADGDNVTKYVMSNPNKPSEDMTIEVTNRQVADILDSFANVEIVRIVVCGQRRFYAGGHSLALAEKQYETDPQAFEWFATVHSPQNLTELHEKILDENGTENETQRYSLVGLVRNAIRLLDERPLLGVTDLGRLLGLADTLDPKTGKVASGGSKYGKRQQVYRVASLAALLPEAEIGKRIGMEETTYAASHATKAGKAKYVKGDWIPLAKLHKEDVACLLGERKEPTDVIKVLMPTYEKGKPCDVATFERYVKTVVDGEKPRGAITPRELEQYMKHARIANAKVTCKDMATAIIAGNTEWFDNLS